MTALSSDFTQITSQDATAAGHPAWPAFQSAMTGRAFGGEALWDAWSWFRDGWDAKIKELWHASTDTWCNEA